MSMSVILSCIAAVLLVCMFTPAASSGAERADPGNPRSHAARWKIRLQQQGYGTTAEDLSRALKDPGAVDPALRYIDETSQHQLFGDIESVLHREGASPISKYYAARILARNDRKTGLEWLRSWERLSDDELAALDAHSVTAVISAASDLARRGDQRLSRHIHKLLPRSQTLVARSLANFSDLSDEHVERTWIEAAGLAKETLLVEERPPHGYSEQRAFLNALQRSSVYLTSRLHSRPTPAMMEAFERLAAVEVGLPDAREERVDGRAIDLNSHFRERAVGIRDAWKNTLKSTEDG